MSAVNHALQRIMKEIPREILNKAFVNNNPYASLERFSLEDRIRNDVITVNVIPDLNLVGGEIVKIYIGDLPYKDVQNARVFDIPLNMTQGRHISVVHSIENGTSDLGATGEGQGCIQQLQNATQGVQATGTARVELVGPNSVVVYDEVLGVNAFLRCRLENDGQLRNLSPAYYRDFGKLCVLAAKSIIHTRIAISLGDSSENGGQSNSYMASFVDGYGDAQELYDELLENKMTRVFLLQDRKTHNEILRMQIG